MADTYNEILLFLKDLGLEELSKEDKALLKEKTANSNDSNITKKELEMLYVLNRILLSTYQKVSLENMYKISETLDGQMAMKLFVEFQQIKSKSIDRYTCLERFKVAIQNILFNQKEANKEVRKSAKTIMNSKELLENALYHTMLDKNKADKLIKNCIRRSSLFLSKCDSENLRTLTQCLKENFKLNDDELVMISSRCATFFASASASKVNNLYIMLNEYKDFVEKRLDKSKDKEALNLLKRDFKDVLISSSLLAAADSEKVSETIKFLMGYKLGEINPYVGKYDSFKGEFTASQLARIYNNSITSLSMGIDHIFDFVSNISILYRNIFDKELNLDGFINGRNFSGLSRLSKIDFEKDGKANQILKMLKPFISAENMENLLKNHVGFLSCDVDVVKSGLKDALIESNTPEELRRNILKKIRNSFDASEGEYVDIERKKGVSIGSLNKVEVNALEEEDMAKFLSKIGAKNDEIETWKKNWNKESKEIRNLEIEIKLEEILKDCDELEMIIPFNFVSMEDFLSENDEVNELYNDLLGQFNEISSLRLNKKLATLSEECEGKLFLLKKSINKNYDRVISLLDEQINLIAIDLDEGMKKEEKYRENLYRYLSNEKEIEENELTDENMELVELSVTSLKESLKTASAIAKRLREKRGEIKEGIEIVRKMFILNYDENDEPIGVAFTPVLKGMDGEELFNNFIYLLDKEELLNDMDIKTNKRVYGIGDFTRYISLFEEEDERKIMLAVREELQECKEYKQQACDLLKSILKRNGEKFDENITFVEARQKVEELYKVQYQVYQDSLELLKETKKLDEKLEKTDIEALRESLETLKVKIEDLISKKNKIINKK